MTNRLSIWLFLIVVALIFVDHLMFDQAGLIFLGRQFMDLIQYIAIWR